MLYVDLIDTASGCRYGDSVYLNIFEVNNLMEISEDTSLCNTEGFSLSISHDFDPNYTVTWSPSAEVSNANIINPQVVGAGDHTLYAEMRDSSGCSIQRDTVVLIESAPSFVFDNPDTTLCYGIQIQTNGMDSTLNSTYQWSPAVGVNNVNQLTPVITPDTSRYYALTVTDSIGCVKKDSFLVSLEYVPEFEPQADTNTCFGVPLTVDYSNSNFSYLWFDGDTNMNKTLRDRR